MHPARPSRSGPPRHGAGGSSSSQLSLLDTLTVTTRKIKTRSRHQQREGADQPTHRQPERRSTLDRAPDCGYTGGESGEARPMACARSASDANTASCTREASPWRADHCRGPPGRPLCDDRTCQSSRSTRGTIRGYCGAPAARGDRPLGRLSRASASAWIRELRLPSMQPNARDRAL
jgi:hypothetical protein